jgi:valyl-tRNA synthetase
MAIEPKKKLADLPKAYDPQAVEQRLYRFWEEGGYFIPRIDPNKRPFTISMPPPNVTGALHTGHAITATIEDIMIRYHRMKGDPTLWLPGEDHAGIATQAVVEKQLAKEGTDRHKLGREKFVERTWEWVRQYKHRIQDQHRRLGASTDWTRERFTLDDGLSRAVREVFVRLYEEGLIYRGERIINWCPRCMSAISDLEVEVEDTPAKLYYVRYPLEPIAGETETQYITVATTRPETILGDTAVAVNPRDERYKHLIGRKALLPILNRPIPILGDEAIETGFGTGAMKVTPFHDPTDFEIGNRHNLPRIQAIDFDARMTAEAGPYAGQDRYECRKHLLADLEKVGLLVKAEDYTIPLGHCQRCGTVIEPLVSKQWFVKMAPLATPALNAVRYGLIKIVPERFTKTYTDWLENIRDWNISRQLWWGHRIPVWYCEQGHMTASRSDPDACATCGSAHIEQDPDVLDTWFSSWLWPFSTLGWPDDTPDLRYFYPTSVMETGYDIIFFWVARMVMSGIHFLGTIPFHTIYLHGLVRDEQGRKMSKSLGNVVDPLEIMDKYGTDALRFTLATSSTPGNDMKLVNDRIIGNRNFANKIWNAARFVLAQTDGIGGGIPTLEETTPKTLADRWILSRALGLTASVTQLIEDYQFGEAGRQMYEFFWSDYCDWYLEIAKVQMQGDEARESTAGILRAVLDLSARLLHPFMPYVSEEVWQHLYEGEDERPAAALIVAPWPQADLAQRDLSAETEFARLQDIITRIRDARKQMEVEANKRIPVILAAHGHAAALCSQAPLIEFLARTEPPRIEESLPAAPEQAIALIADGVEVYLPLAGMIDLAQELARLDAEIASARGDIERSEKMLENEQFTSRAKPEIVQKEREKLASHQQKLAKLQERRKELGG